MALLMSARATAAWIALTLLILGGCGSGDPSPRSDRFNDRDDLLGSSWPPNSSSATRNLEKLFDRIGPALVALRDARDNLLRKAAQKPDDVEGLRKEAQSYGNSIDLLRSKLLGLEQDFGPTTTQQFIEAIIDSRIVLSGEIFGEMPLSTSPKQM